MQLWAGETFHVAESIAYDFFGPKEGSSSLGLEEAGGQARTLDHGRGPQNTSCVGAVSTFVTIDGGGAAPVRQRGVNALAWERLTAVDLSKAYQSRAVQALRRQLIYAGLRLAQTLNRSLWDADPSDPARGVVCH